MAHISIVGVRLHNVENELLQNFEKIFELDRKARNR